MASLLVMLLVFGLGAKGLKMEKGQKTDKQAVLGGESREGKTWDDVSRLPAALPAALLDRKCKWTVGGIDRYVVEGEVMEEGGNRWECLEGRMTRLGEIGKVWPRNRFGLGGTYGKGYGVGVGNRYRGTYNKGYGNGLGSRYRGGWRKGDWRNDAGLGGDWRRRRSCSYYVGGRRLEVASGEDVPIKGQLKTCINGRLKDSGVGLSPGLGCTYYVGGRRLEVATGEDVSVKGQLKTCINGRLTDSVVGLNIGLGCTYRVAGRRLEVASGEDVAIKGQLKTCINGRLTDSVVGLSRGLGYQPCTYYVGGRRLEVASGEDVPIKGQLKTCINGRLTESVVGLSRGLGYRPRYGGIGKGYNRGYNRGYNTNRVFNDVYGKGINSYNRYNDFNDIFDDFDYERQQACGGCRWKGRVYCSGDVIEDLPSWKFETRCINGKSKVVARQWGEVANNLRWPEVANNLRIPIP